MSSEQLFYLIVRRTVDAFYYAKDRGQVWWTRDVNKAAKFRTKDEAERAAKETKKPKEWLAVEEHMWTDAGRSPRAEPAPPAKHFHECTICGAHTNDPPHRVHRCSCGATKMDDDDFWPCEVWV